MPNQKTKIFLMVSRNNNPGARGPVTKTGKRWGSKKKSDKDGGNLGTLRDK